MTYPSGAGPALEVEAASIKSKGLSLTFSAKVVFAVVKVMEAEAEVEVGPVLFTSEQAEDKELPGRHSRSSR